MNIKYWVLVGVLVLGVVFLAMDNCSNATKYQRLKGEYEFHKNVTRVIVAEARNIIGKQNKKIGELDERIEFLNGIIEDKDEELTEIEEDLGELKREFKDLQECQDQYNKLVEGFNLCKSISADKDQLIFNLQEKYEAQVKISLEWKSMYESEHDLRLHGEEVTKECDKNLKKLRFLSKVKTGIVVTLAAVVFYNLVK